MIENLTGDGVELEANLETVNFAEFEGKEVKVQSALGFCVDGDHIADILRVDCSVYIMQVGGFATQANAVVNNLTIYFAFRHVYQGHTVFSPAHSNATCIQRTSVPLPAFLVIGPVARL